MCKEQKLGIFERSRGKGVGKFSLPKKTTTEKYPAWEVNPERNAKENTWECAKFPARTSAKWDKL